MPSPEFVALVGRSDDTDLKAAIASAYVSEVDQFEAYIRATGYPLHIHSWEWAKVECVGVYDSDVDWAKGTFGRFVPEGLHKYMNWDELAQERMGASVQFNGKFYVFIP